MIALKALGRNEFARVAHIAVTPAQEPFCGALADHFAADEPGCDFHCVERDGRAVGFFKIDRDYHRGFDFVGWDEIGLRGMQIDAGEQGKGTGKAAMALLHGYLSVHYPAASAVVLTVNTVNAPARAIYLAAGFADTGRLYLGGKIGPQQVLRMALG